VSDETSESEPLDRVAQSVRHALRLVGRPENGVERYVEEPVEEPAVS
jgi:hypothetical protein